MSSEKNVDKRGKLNDMMFDYRIGKDNKVFITWLGKEVKTLKGNEAQRFIENIDGASDYDCQMVMAKVTKNFKRGNERVAKNHNR